MFRNRGIDYRFPRSSGGKFYSARIDEGRSRLIRDWTPELVPVFIPDPVAELWSWNKRNINEFHSGNVILLGNVSGTMNTPTYLSTSGGIRVLPSVFYNFTTNFETAHSAGLAMVPIDPGIPLPRRYQLDMTFRFKANPSFGGGRFGVFFGANQITSSADKANFYGSFVALAGENMDFPYTMNVNTGALGVWRPTGGVPAAEEGPHHIRILIETFQTGTTAGPKWRVILGPSTTRFGSNTEIQENYPNETSGSNGNWIGAGTLDRFGFFFQRMLSGTVSNNDSACVEIFEASIKRHPKDF